MTVVDRDLRNGAEHKSAGGGEFENGREDARDDVEADEAGEAAGAGYDCERAGRGVDQAAGEGDAFGFVGIEEFLRSAVVEDVGEFPGKIHGPADAVVHA